MRRMLMKTLSLVLGSFVSTAAHAQDDYVICEYGVVPPPDWDEPVPLYGIEEPIYLPEPPPPPPLLIKGRVLKAGTEEGIEGAQVMLGDRKLLSGPDGVFAFSVPPPEGSPTWDLLVEDVDGAEHGGTFAATKLEVRFVDGALSPVIAEQGLTVELKPR